MLKFGHSDLAVIKNDVAKSGRNLCSAINYAQFDFHSYDLCNSVNRDNTTVGVRTHSGK